FGATVLLWKVVGYWVKAALSIIVLLALAALSAWHLGSVGAPGGLLVLGQSTSTLATLGLLGAQGLSGYLIAGMPFLRRSGRIALLAVAAYCLAPFVLGLVTGQTFTAIASGATSWPLPYWSRGPFLGIYILLPLG